MTVAFKQAVVYTNLSREALIEEALKRGEGKLSANRSLVVLTGSRTGRSPKDRFIVQSDLTRNTVDWGAVNQPIDETIFNCLWKKAQTYLQNRDSFVSDLFVGADERYTLPVKVQTELAWHHLFVKNLFLSEQEAHSSRPQWELLCVPSLPLNPLEDGTASEGVLIINFEQRKVLSAGLYYAGEMKKAFFTVLNYLLPAENVLPMHCAANQGKEGDLALFFGLSGTGKTSLSADEERYLIGDDEHGWSAEGVFNFEGGCYAKCINLSPKQEPVIFNAIRYGSLMENVVLDPKTQEPDFDDARFTQNTRVAYPREFIPLRVPENAGAHPKAVFFLTCDLYGVLPPVARLNKAQAAYYFLSGYTALVGSTEMGSSAEIKPTFSTCFGAPFFPRPAQVYADLLMKRLEETQAQVYLINTGWTGGAYGQGGERFPIATTRAIIKAILNNEFHLGIEGDHLAELGFDIPKKLSGVDPNCLNPEKTWIDKLKYQENLKKLIENFNENFTKFNVSDEIGRAGPSSLK